MYRNIYIYIYHRAWKLHQLSGTFRVLTIQLLSTWVQMLVSISCLTWKTNEIILSPNSGTFLSSINTGNSRVYCRESYWASEICDLLQKFILTVVKFQYHWHDWFCIWPEAVSQPKILENISLRSLNFDLVSLIRNFYLKFLKSNDLITLNFFFLFFRIWTI